MYENLKEHLNEILQYWGQDIVDDDVLDFSKFKLADYIDESESFKLYHYMPANYYNIRNFETQKIHLSDNNVMNDIFEGIPVLDEKISYERLNNLKDIAKMYCLTENNANILMWSHYADSHKGICVEYDLKNLTEDPFDTKKYLFPVVYKERRSLVRNVDILINSVCELNKAIAENYVYEPSDSFETLDDLLPLFVSKGKEWKYEDEWRIIFTKKHMYNVDKDKLYSGNIEFKCISGIYLGYRIGSEIRKNILEIAERLKNETERKINVYQSMIDKEKYLIKFEQIN